MEDPKAVVNEQADDEGLWFIAQTPGEDMLQKALRRLHAAIEGKTPEECAKAALRSVTPSGHARDCEWHCDQVPHECTCHLSQ